MRPNVAVLVSVSIWVTTGLAYGCSSQERVRPEVKATFAPNNSPNASPTEDVPVPIPKLGAIPGQGQIAFASNRRGNFDLYLTTGDGRTRPVTSSKSDEYSPSWSPDGTMLVFVKWQGPTTDLFLLELSNRTVSQLTDSHNLNDGDPSWSPDGNRILFSSGHRFDDERSLYSIDPDGSHERAIVRSSMNDFELAPAWSPSGKAIAWQRDPEDDDGGRIYVADVCAIGACNRRALTDEIFNNEVRPAWSPDGEMIAFSRDDARTDNSPAEMLDFDLFILRNGAADPQRLEEEPSDSYVGNWSPDGEWIVFWSDRSGSGDIYTINARSGKLIRLTSGQARDMDPAWSPE